jgi:Ca-activated chloride channel family protein
MPDKNVADSVERVPPVRFSRAAPSAMPPPFVPPADVSAAPVVAQVAASSPSPAAESKKAAVPPQAAQSEIALKPWSANAAYITRMKAAPADQLYAIYLDERPSYANSSAFYLDVADMLFQKGQRDLGLRVLSNLAEMDLENRQVLRILGYRLMEAGAPDLAIPVLRKVQQLAEDEPQSFRDLGLAYAAAGHYQDAIDQLNELSLRTWDGRFQDIDLIAIGELNAIVATRNSAQHPLDLSHVDPRLLKNLPLDLRAVMTWDADNSDMDLWVTDPSGEKCYFGHANTVQGGRISRDVTQGYGPEEFILHHAKPGKYKIEANFYGNRQQVVAGATTVQVKLTTGFGTAHAQDKMMTLRLRDRGDTVYIGEIDIK